MTNIKKNYLLLYLELQGVFMHVEGRVHCLLNNKDHNMMIQFNWKTFFSLAGQKGVCIILSRRIDTPGTVFTSVKTAAQALAASFFSIHVGVNACIESEMSDR